MLPRRTAKSGPVAGGDNRRVLLQRAEQGRFVALLRIDGEVNKRRRGVVPLLKVHGVGKIGITPWEPAGTRLAISSSSE